MEAREKEGGRGERWKEGRGETEVGRRFLGKYNRYKQPPVTMQERFKVLQTMHAHSQYCWYAPSSFFTLLPLHLPLSLLPLLPPLTFSVPFLFPSSQIISFRSGDNTLEATEWAIEDIAKHEADERFVFVVSDANLARYGITPQEVTPFYSLPSPSSLPLLLLTKKKY